MNDESSTHYHITIYFVEISKIISQVILRCFDTVNNVRTTFKDLLLNKIEEYTRTFKDYPRKLLNGPQYIQHSATPEYELTSH